MLFSERCKGSEDFLKHTSMLDKMQKDLEAVGFQEKEAKVYLASLELGAATAQQIAQKAGVKRPTTYFILEGLMGQGLATSFHQGKKQFFIAEAPDRLLQLLDQERQEITVREEKFRSILPQLHSINNRQKEKPVVKYYEGKEGILTMVSEHARACKGQEAYSAYSRDVVENFVSQNELKGIIQERVDQGVKIKTIYTYAKGDLPGAPNTQRIRLSEKEFPINCDIAIYEDRIRIASLKDRLIGVVIEDKEIANSFKVIFDLAWKWVKANPGR